VAGGASEAAVTSDEGNVEQLGEGDVHRVVGRHVSAELPNAREKQSVRMACRRKSPEERDGNLARFVANLMVKRSASDDVRDFGVKEVRGVKILNASEQSLQGSRCSLAAEENLRRD
jgi:hypothetical protein